MPILILFFLFQFGHAETHTVKVNTYVPELEYKFKLRRPILENDEAFISAERFMVKAKYIRTDEAGYSYWSSYEIEVDDYNLYKSLNNDLKKLIPKEKQLDEPQYNLQSYAAPISFSLLNNSRSIYGGYNLSNLIRDNADFIHGFSITDTYQKGEGEGQEASYRLIQANSTFEYYLTDRLTYFNTGSFRKQKINGDYQIKEQYNVGPLGLRYKFILGNSLKFVSLSYIPLVEYLTSDFNIAYPGESSKRTTIIIRNSLQLKGNYEKNRIMIDYSYYFKPAYQVQVGLMDWVDSDQNSTLTIGYRVTSKFSIQFTNIYTRDIRLRRSNGVRPDNTINSFVISYMTNF